MKTLKELLEEKKPSIFVYYPAIDLTNWFGMSVVASAEKVGSDILVANSWNYAGKYHGDLAIVETGKGSQLYLPSSETKVINHEILKHLDNSFGNSWYILIHPSFLESEEKFSGLAKTIGGILGKEKNVDLFIKPHWVPR